MLNGLQFLIIIFASFRLTRLIVNDKITEFIRKPFHKTIEEMTPDGKTETYIEIKGTGLRYWIGELLSCHWCTGIWSAAFLYLMYIFWPQYSWPVTMILAIAGGASILQTIIEKE
ncbi:DUF1360 domain-containing protein [Pseudoneobacillus sp. C159]